MHVIIPVLIITAFKAINFNELLCPNGKEVKISEDNFDLVDRYMSVEYDIEDGSLNPYELKGRDCYIAVLKTGCKFHYFGSNDIVQVIERKTTDIKNCDQLSSDVMTFPEANCASGLFDNSYHYTELEYIVTRSKNHMYDPSLGDIMDYSNIFDKKSNNIYHYKGSKGYWKKDDYQSKATCDTFKEHEYSDLEVRVWRSKAGSKLIIDVRGKIYDTDELCYHEHCGVKLAITKDHVYFKLPLNINIKRCDLESKEVYSNSEIEEERSEFNDCITAKIDMAWKKSISYEELKNFNPSTSGIHPVYKLSSNHTLYKALAKYSEVNTTDLHKYLEWVKCGNKTKCSYNGEIRADMIDLYGDKLSENDFKIHLEEIKLGIKAYPKINMHEFDHNESKIYTKGNNSLLALIYLAAPWVSEAILVVIIVFTILKCIKPKNKRNRNIILKRRKVAFEDW